MLSNTRRKYVSFLISLEIMSLPCMQMERKGGAWGVFLKKQRLEWILKVENKMAVLARNSSQYRSVFSYITHLSLCLVHNSFYFKSIIKT